jgi:TPR repeat protein
VDLSRMIERGDIPAFDPTKAFELRNVACRGGDGASCRTAAHFLLNAEPPYRVLGEVSTLLDRGCKHGDAASCDDLPVVRGAPPDSILPRDAVRCLGGSLGACVLAAGTGRGPEAAQLWERACQHGGGWHCSEAAWRYRAPQWRCDESNVCRYIDHPHGAEGTGLRRAVQLYERGCELGFGMACCEAAYLRIHGDPGSRDRQLAEKLYARAAAAGFGQAGACDLLRAEGVR